MNFCTYNLASGEILRWTTDAEPPPPGCVCEKREFDPRDGVIVGGKFVLRQPSPPTVEQKWEAVRQKRNRIFAATVDRINPLRWDDMPTKDRIAWKEYRRALQDITTQADPDNIVWPTPPSS